MAEPEITFRIKFASSDPDLTLAVPSTSTFALIIQQLKEAKQWQPAKHVRILCAGREMFPNDSVTKAAAKILHCMATDATPRIVSPVRKASPPPAPPPEQPPVDWLDVVDPGVILMWIFGSILGLLWLLFIFYAHMFDRTSVVMLCMMTVAFLIPCVLSYMPWPAFLHTHPRPVPNAGTETFDPATGRSTAVHHPAAWNRHVPDESIPPRPQPRVRVGT